MNKCAVICAAAALVCAGSAFGVMDVNGVKMESRLFNDYPTSTLNVTNNYPSLVQWDESNFGSGGFANKHVAWYSTDAGATRRDFNYGDAFDMTVTVDLDASPTTGREAGFVADLFGFGIFGVLPNGEIAAFGSVLPFHSFGNVWTPGQEVTLRMIHTPGSGDGVMFGPSVPSTMEYIYDLGMGPVSSGPIAFTTGEGGIPQGPAFNIGFGVQSQGAPGGRVIATFTNSFVVPAPGAAALVGLGGLVALRRRR